MCHRTDRAACAGLCPAVRTYNFQDTRATYPSYNCVIAHSYYSYDVYIGDDTYLQQQTAKYFQDNPGLLKVRPARMICKLMACTAAGPAAGRL
jgi:hypothetical protein